MTDEKILKLWNKKCLKKGLTPIALLAVDKYGFPHVFSQHNADTLKKVYKHLAEAPELSETTTFEGREN